MCVKKILSTIKWESIYRRNHLQYRLKRFKPISVVSAEETLTELINGRRSLCRFGEGEFAWMDRIEQNSFQKNDRHLSERLEEIIRSEDEDIMIAIPGVFSDLSEFQKDTRRFWTNYLNAHRREWERYLDPDRVYYNTLCTRYYIDRQDMGYAKKMVQLLKHLWWDMDVVIIEGEYTRIGVGNDLLSNAASVRRVICPATDAFSIYDDIYSYATTLDKRSLYLIALGPTATVLSYDMAKAGFRAIDIGHIDIEYEWYRKRSTKKEPIVGKYVNEGMIYGDRSKEDIDLSKYIEEILYSFV